MLRRLPGDPVWRYGRGVDCGLQYDEDRKNGGGRNSPIRSGHKKPCGRI